MTMKGEELRYLLDKLNNKSKEVNQHIYQTIDSKSEIKQTAKYIKFYLDCNNRLLKH